KMRSKKASASSMPPTSTATWLIPTGRGIGSSLASDVEADDRPAVVDDPDRTPADRQGERLKRIQHQSPRLDPSDRVARGHPERAETRRDDSRQPGVLTDARMRPVRGSSRTV